jgi:outer membrane receptor protein involved in Fe transport
VGTELITITREDIQKTGLARTEDVVRTLPQNFSGGPNERAENINGGGTNPTRGATANLRGLGATSTLVLIDGHRMAAGGTTFLNTDVSSIPLGAIERIEVLPDGASALYGSDAIGGVINFVLRKQYSGVETQVRMGWTPEGNSHDYGVDQTFGMNWSSGQALLTYEFMDREEILASDRPFAADSDKRALGGTNYSARNNNPGTIQIGTNTWAIPAGQDGSALRASDLLPGQVNFRNLSDGFWLLPEQRRHSVVGTLSQDLGDRVKLFSQVLYTRREPRAVGPNLDTTLSVPRTNPFYVNPTGGTAPVSVLYNYTDDFGPLDPQYKTVTYNALLGATVTLTPAWSLTVDTGYGRVEDTVNSQAVNQAAVNAALGVGDPSRAFNPFGDGSATSPAVIESIRQQSILTTNESASDVRSATAIADGALLKLPGGDVRLALGTQYQDYRVHASTVQINPLAAAPTLVDSRLDRTVRGTFAELFVPLVGPDNARTAVKRLELSLAGRNEHYSDYGNSTVPRVGLTWAPLDELSMRASWSRAFRAPDLVNLDDSNKTVQLVPLPDPLSPTNSSQVALLNGGNADLGAETAKVWTAGFDVKPLARLSLGVTYFDINYRDRLIGAFSGISVANALRSVQQDPTLAPFVIRNPTTAQREALCNDALFSGTTTLATCLANTQVILDTRVQNISVYRTRGIDLLGAYALPTRVGDLSFGLNATYVLDLDFARVDGAPLVSQLNTLNNPVDLRVRGTVSWAHRDLVGTVSAAYIDNYFDAAPTVSTRRPISSWTTFDMSLRYEPSAATGLFTGTSLSLSAVNAFNRDPPFVNTQFGFDSQNATATGRVLSVVVSKHW